MNNFVKDWQKNKKILKKNHVYKELDEHSSCGVGLIASLDGSYKREIVEMGVQALKVYIIEGLLMQMEKLVMAQVYNLVYLKNFLERK